jgi:hypothetical protein
MAPAATDNRKVETSRETDRVGDERSEWLKEYRAKSDRYFNMRRIYRQRADELEREVPLRRSVNMINGWGEGRYNLREGQIEKIRRDRDDIRNFLNSHPEKQPDNRRLSDVSIVSLLQQAIHSEDTLWGMTDGTVIQQILVENPQQFSALKKMVIDSEKQNFGETEAIAQLRAADVSDFIVFLDKLAPKHDALRQKAFQETGLPESVRDTRFIQDYLYFLEDVHKRYLRDTSSDLDAIQRECEQLAANMFKLATAKPLSARDESELRSILAPIDPVSASAEERAILENLNRIREGTLRQILEANANKQPPAGGN